MMYYVENHEELVVFICHLSGLDLMLLGRCTWANTHWHIYTPSVVFIRLGMQ